jgi:hypothetical protein
VHKLRNAVEVYGAKNWKLITSAVPTRTDVQCLHRWQKVLRPGLVKGPWTPEEDDAVRRLVATFGTKKWSEISAHLEGRLGKQVSRERGGGSRRRSGGGAMGVRKTLDYYSPEPFFPHCLFASSPLAVPRAVVQPPGPVH